MVLFIMYKAVLTSKTLQRNPPQKRKIITIIIKSVRTLTLLRATPAQLELINLWLYESRAYLKSCIAVKSSGLPHCIKPPIYN